MQPYLRDPAEIYRLSFETIRREVPIDGLPEDIAGLAVFLASDESAYCTGGIYMADGGMTAV